MTPRKITRLDAPPERARALARLSKRRVPNHPTGRSRRLHRRLRRFRRRRRDGNAERDVIAGSATVRRAKIALTATVRAHSSRARRSMARAHKNQRTGFRDLCIRKKTPSGHERESRRVASRRFVVVVVVVVRHSASTRGRIEGARRSSRVVSRRLASLSLSRATRPRAMATPETSAAARPKTLYQGVERDGFGMRLLEKMGWVEGRGLGKRQDGISRHIHARKRAVGVGVGADARRDASGANATDWTMNTVAFDDVLRSLNRAHSVDDVCAGGDGAVASSSSSGGGEEEAAEKKKKKEKKRAATKEEKKAAKKAAKRAKKNEIVVNRTTVSHAGRYQKRESQKMVKNYSAEDLGAILGGGFVSLPEVRADVGNATDDEEEIPTPVKMEAEKEKPKKLVVCERPKWVFDPPPENWWGWRVGFRPEGHGQKSDGDDADALERKRGFDEDDQVNLFQDTHAGANKNRRGLGANRGKDAGADFSGTKKTFGEADDVSDAEKAAAKAAKSVKWQKIAEKVLSKADGSMKTKKFMEKVLKKAECDFSDDGVKDIYRDAAFHILSRSGLFTSLEEETVSLQK